MALAQFFLIATCERPALRSFLITLNYLLLALALAGNDTTKAAQMQKLLPKDAAIAEVATVKGVAERVLVLWMISPKQVYRTADSVCDWLYGDYLYVPVRLSLVDTGKNRVINTIEIHGIREQNEASFPLPFRVPKLSYYTSFAASDEEQRPKILRLRNLTGEGVDGQFVLFEFESCNSTLTSVFGYSPRLDHAIQYEIETHERGKPPKVDRWLPYLFTQAPAVPGFWNFTWEPGYGADCWIHQTVRFDRKRQIFINRQKITPYPDSLQSVGR